MKLKLFEPRNRTLLEAGAPKLLFLPPIFITLQLHLQLHSMAREQAPSIVFIDEVDAIGTKRFDSQTGADREVQRILLELLNQMDGFDQTTSVKV